MAIAKIMAQTEMVSIHLQIVKGPDEVLQWWVNLPGDLDNDGAESF